MFCSFTDPGSTKPLNRLKAVRVSLDHSNYASSWTWTWTCFPLFAEPIKALRLFLFFADPIKSRRCFLVFAKPIPLSAKPIKSRICFALFTKPIRSGICFPMFATPIKGLRFVLYVTLDILENWFGIQILSFYPPPPTHSAFFSSFPLLAL